MKGKFVEYLGITIMLLAIIGGIGFGGYELWRRGKLTRLGFLPKPPTQETKS